MDSNFEFLSLEEMDRQDALARMAGAPQQSANSQYWIQRALEKMVTAAPELLEQASQIVGETNDMGLLITGLFEVVVAQDAMLKTTRAQRDSLDLQLQTIVQAAESCDPSHPLIWNLMRDFTDGAHWETLEDAAKMILVDKLRGMGLNPWQAKAFLEHIEDNGERLPQQLNAALTDLLQVMSETDLNDEDDEDEGY